MNPWPYRVTPEGLELFVRLQPGASRSQFGGLREGADGRLSLEARVTAPPEGGRANAALVKLLSKELGLAKGAITITGGQTAREKTLALTGDGAVLAARLQVLLSS